MTTNRQGVTAPSQEEPADAVMTFRLTRSQQDGLRKRAAEQGCKPSFYLRYLVQADLDYHEQEAA